ncbi:TBC1 domain family member 24-like protein [Dinothrombium tinctorium]|uniref:TBC1 domain family member 24-like protein n=1 Tax=Dinothrombium tinctorium TaxID=1965070 RepID=A0A3S3PNC0_9ACAR|nr:TBC1 domain family member 24-like protein [Dinothrombium tinctorium]
MSSKNTANGAEISSDSERTKSNSIEEIRFLHKVLNDRNWKVLKTFTRNRGWSVNDDTRSELWILLAAIYKKGYSEINSDEISNDESTGQRSPHKLPHFVDPHYCRFFNLNANQQRNVEKVVWAIARDHPEITYCPLLYPFAALFLHFYDVKSTYVSLSYLLEAPASGTHRVVSNGQSLLPQTKAQLLKDAFVLIKLTNQFGIFPPRRFFAEQRKKLKKDSEIDACFRDWLKWIFIGLPFEHIVRVIDCFLVEGTKFLFRTALALLLLYRRSFPTSTFILGAGVDPGTNFNLSKMLAFCAKINVSPNELIKYSLQITRFSRANIDNEYRKAESCISKITTSPNPSISSSPRKQEMINLDQLKIVKSTRVAPRTLQSSILNYELLDILWEWLPEKVIVNEPKIIFCSNEDGNSLNTFFLKTANYEPTILLVKTETKEIFGAYCSSSWSQRLESDEKGATNYYFGTGETFLFTLKPKEAYYPWVGGQEYGHDTSNVPHSSQLFMAASSKMISVGAGNGIGLWLDENLTNGTSTRCDTFDNKPLSSSESFTISVVEVIGFE